MLGGDLKLFLEGTCLESSSGTWLQIRIASFLMHCPKKTANEFVNVARNKARLDWSEIREYVALLRDACEIAPITDQEQDLALEIAERYRYRWYNSLIIASAVASGAPLLLSEDLHDGQAIGDLVIQNPFGKEAPVS